ERNLVGEAAEPVDAVDQRGHLRVVANLGELLVTPVHVSEYRFGGDYLLTVEFENDSEGAVGRGVLRTHVEGHSLLGLELQVHTAVGGLGVGVGQHLAFGERSHSPASSSSSASS